MTPRPKPIPFERVSFRDGPTATRLSVASFFLSLIGLVLYLATAPEENPTATLADPPVAAAAGSWIAIPITVTGYGIWSAWQLRTLPRDTDRPTALNPVKLLAYAIAVFVANKDDLNAYDRRLRSTVWAFVGVVIWGPFTAGMLVGSPGRQPV